MVNAQEWLDKEYPKNAGCKGGFDSKNRGKLRKEIEELDISNRNLEGSLKLEGFDKLRKFRTFNSKENEGTRYTIIGMEFEVKKKGKKTKINEISELDLSGAPKLEEVYCKHSSIEKLTVKNNKELIKLICSNNKLKELDISGLKKLKELRCNQNSDLSKLIISELDNLEYLACRVCNLESIGLGQLNPEKLELLDLLDNNLSSLPDLACFRKFTNLRRLTIGNYWKEDEKVKQGIYNRICGSLKDLENMSKLNWLDIANTDVDSGLEYLPISVEKLFCDNNKRSEAKCKKIMDQLNSFRSLDETYGGSYDFRTWKLNEQNRILKDELEQRVSQLEKEVTLLLESTGRLIHNVLLIGKTGNGKSTLANTLTNTNNFKEGKYGVSETRDIQMEVFEENVKEKRIKYRVIDTVGIGDTRLTEREVLYKLAEAAYLVKDGLNQVLFVTSGRFTKEEILAYDLLRKVIFDEKVTDYTTIVRTRFTDFLNKNECQNDIDVIKKENKQLTGVIESCNRIVHVENSLEKREESRSILLEHLAGCQDIYKPQSLKELNSRISNAITKKKQLEKSLIEIQSGKGSNSSTISDYQRQIEKEKENICKETQEHIIKKGWNEKWKNCVKRIKLTKSSVKSEIIITDCDQEKVCGEEIGNNHVIYESWVSNNKDHPIKHTVKYMHKKIESRTWNNSAGLEIGADISFKAGVPFFIEGGFGLNPKTNYSHQWGGFKSEEKATESSAEVEVLANSKSKITVTAKKFKITVPFKYIERITYTDGKTEETFKAGTYEGIELYNINMEVKNEKITESANTKISSDQENFQEQPPQAYIETSSKNTQ